MDIELVIIEGVFIIIAGVFISGFVSLFIMDINPLCAMFHSRYHKEEVSFGKGRHIHCKKCGHNTILG